LLLLLLLLLLLSLEMWLALEQLEGLFELLLLLSFRLHMDRMMLTEVVRPRKHLATLFTQKGAFSCVGARVSLEVFLTKKGLAATQESTRIPLFSSCWALALRCLPNKDPDLSGGVVRRRRRG